MDTFHTAYDPITKIWSGRPLPALTNPNANVGQMLLNALDNRPNHVGQINYESGIRMTNRELKINAIRVAQHLEMLGIKSGDVVAIAASNHHHLASVVFGLLALAAPVSTMDPGFKSAEFTHMLSRTLPKLIICDFECLSNLRKSLTEVGLDIPVFTFGEIQDGTRSVDEFLIPTGMEHDFVPTLLTDGYTQMAIIVCSSGSTGLSKAVKISHAILLNHFYNCSYTNADDIHFYFGSLFWMSGVLSLITPTLSGSTRIITKQKFSAQLLVEITKKHHVTTVFLAAFNLQLFTQWLTANPTDLQSIKRLFAGGTQVPKALRQLFKQLLPDCTLYVLYGISELAGRISMNRSEIVSTSVGQLMHGIRVRLVNEAGENCGPNEDGELLISTDFPFLGYMNDAKASADALDSWGWFKTGDVTRFDDDNELFIVDRKVDIIYTYNCKISPTIMESVVLGVKGVREVCVVGLPVLGVEQLPAALVIQNKQEHIVTEEEINDLLKDNFSDRHQLHGGVYFVDEMPKTVSGKVLRREVVKIATEFYHNRNGNR